MPLLADRSVSPPRYSHAPAALSLTLADLVAADGHRVSAAVSVVVRLLERPADIAVFDEQLTGDPSVTLDDVRQYLSAALRGGAAEFVATRGAQQLVDESAHLQTKLLERLNAIGFGCGLEFLPPMSLRISSDSLAADRLAAAAARRQTAALEHAAALQQRLQSVGGAAHLPAADQAELLPSLLRAEATARATLWIAAGPNVLAIDLPDHTARAIAAPEAIGPLRSVRPVRIDGQTLLAVGGQCGVALIDPAGRNAPQILTVNTAGSARGFNSVAFDATDRQIVGAHGELGVVRWPLDQSAEPRITPLLAARQLLQIDDRRLAASGGDVVLLGPTTRTVHSDPSPVIAMLDLADALFVVRASGAVTRLDRTTLEAIYVLTRPTPLRCAAAFNVGGLRTLLLGTEAGVIECVTLAGQVLTHWKLRAGVSLAAAAGGAIAALSADRSTIEWFDANATPPAQLNLVARFGHRATDLVPSPGTPGEGTG